MREEGRAATDREVQLRSATTDDAEALMRLERDTCLVGLAHIFDPPFPEDEVQRRWQDVLADQGSLTLVATIPHDSTLAGYASIRGTTLRHFGVDPRHYGTALAPDLLAAASAQMSAAGPGPLRLKVLQENHRARRFYEKHGWYATGETSVSEFPPHPVELRYQRD